MPFRGMSRRAVSDCVGVCVCALVPCHDLHVTVAARFAVLGDVAFTNTNADEMGLVGRLGFAARNAVYSLVLLIAPLRTHHMLSTLPTDAPYTFPLPSAAMSVAYALLALPIS